MYSLRAFLDHKDVIAKVSGAICAFYGLIMFLAPQKGRDLYNTKDLELKDPKSWEVHDFIGRRHALCMITASVAWWLHVELDMSRDEAIGVVTLPWILLCLHSLLNETPKQLGSSPRADYVCLAMFSFVAYATLTHATYSNLSVKILAGFALANGLMLFMNPAATGSLYGAPERDDFINLIRRCYGNNLIALGAFTGTFAWGLPHLKAVGITWATVGVGMFFLLDDLKKFKVAMAPMFVWLVLAAFFGITLSV
jgi:hypothetical protein